MTPAVPVLHVVRPAAGGIRQHVIALIRWTDAALFSLSLAGPQEFLDGLPTRLPLNHSEPLEISTEFSLGRDVSAARRLSRLVRSGGLVHAHGLRAAFIAALAHRLRPFPFIFTAHNLVPSSRLARLAVRFTGHRASRIIAISQAVADGLIGAGIAGGKVAVIPNGVDITYFETRSPRREHAYTVGCVARLSPEKGVDVLLAAAARLPDVAFLIAGDGPERENYRHLAPPNVQWLGRIPDTRTVYAEADVIAIPSRQEGQGIVALEAMAAGLPLVASRVGGLAEMLTDGETARLVPPEDPDALAAALAALNDDLALRTRLVAAGQTLVRERYAIQTMVEAVEGIYRTLTAG